MHALSIEIIDVVLYQNVYTPGVLRNWTEAFGSAATYQCLARALQHPIVGLPRLAVKYCDVHVCRDTSEGEDVFL